MKCITYYWKIRYYEYAVKEICMIFSKSNEKRDKKRIERNRRKKQYDQVYALHEQAEFLCYINDAYKENFQGTEVVKLEGLVAKGTGKVEDTYFLYSCYGQKKAEITIEELYFGSNKVERIEGGDKRVALYPKEQDVPYKAGDILCKLQEEK